MIGHTRRRLMQKEFLAGIGIGAALALAWRTHRMETHLGQLMDLLDGLAAQGDRPDTTTR